MAAKKTSRIWEFLIIFALIYLGSELIFRYVFPSEENTPPAQPIVFEMQNASIRYGTTPAIRIENNTSEPLAFDEHCPLPPLTAFRVGENNQLTDVTSSDTVIDCKQIEPIAAGESVNYDLAPWKQSIFGEVGVYELRLNIADQTAEAGSGVILSDGIVTRLEITEPGFFTKLFRAFITKPILNALIFIASVTPGHNLGLAIIIITLAIKLLLFIPTQHALEGQKKMQLLQPKLEAIRRQYKDDAQKMQTETMKLWKDHKVNPFQSCLPLLVQFPVLIGLFYVIRDGWHIELSRHLVYSFYQDLSWTFNTQFLGFDLTQKYVWVFPPLLVILQFIQMRLTFHISDKKKAKELKETTTPEADTPQEVQQKVMLYALPLMIGFFAIRFPSAVSIYWGVSTLFAIGQQLIVNREHINVRN